MRSELYLGSGRHIVGIVFLRRWNYPPAEGMLFPPYNN